jgi:hypothetical protein
VRDERCEKRRQEKRRDEELFLKIWDTPWATAPENGQRPLAGPHDSSLYYTYSNHRRWNTIHLYSLM